MSTIFCKKHLKWLLPLIFICSIMYLFSDKTETEKKDMKFLNLGTAGVTGLYYPTGGMICKLLNNYSSLKNTKCSVQATSGSMYNLNTLKRGYMDMGLVQYDWLYNAYFAKQSFKNREPMKNLRLLLSLHEESFTTVVRANSDIYDFNDIKDYKVNIGAPGSGTLGTMMSIMEVKNWTKETFKLASDLKSSEEAESLCDKKIDVMTDTIGHPNGALQEASSACKPHGSIRIIGLDKQTRDELLRNFPYYQATVIPCDLYALSDDNNETGKLCEDIKTIGLTAMLVATDELSDEIAYNVVKQVSENLSSLRSMHNLFDSLTAESLVPRSEYIPIHDGAIRYFKEKNLL